MVFDDEPSPLQPRYHHIGLVLVARVEGANVGTAKYADVDVARMVGVGAGVADAFGLWPGLGLGVAPDTCHIHRATLQVPCPALVVVV